MVDMTFVQAGVEACGSMNIFDRIDVAIGFLQFVGHQINGDQFIALIKHALPTSPGAWAAAADAVKACTGTGA